MSFTKLLGHMLLASMFISGGANTFMNPDGPAPKVANAGIPKPRQSAIVNGAVMVVAGTTLALGIAPKLSALVLLGALIPTTYAGHPFWKEEAPGNRMNQQIHFTKNLSMIGGLLAVLSEKD